VPLGEEIPLERGHQRGVPLINRYFTTIGSSSVRTVADRHRFAAHQNKHLTLNDLGTPKYGVLVIFFSKFQA